jgi:hypothetical protein
LNYGKADRSTPQGAFRIELRKSSLSKRTQEKTEPFSWLSAFLKAKAAAKSPTKHNLRLSPIIIAIFGCQRVIGNGWQNDNDTYFLSNSNSIAKSR